MPAVPAWFRVLGLSVSVSRFGFFGRFCFLLRRGFDMTSMPPAAFRCLYGTVRFLGLFQMFRFFRIYGSVRSCRHVRLSEPCV